MICRPDPLKKISSIFFFVLKVAQYYETNEKSIIRFLQFLVFKVWSFKIPFFFTIWLKNIYHRSKSCAMFWNGLFSVCVFLLRFLYFELWWILYFTVVVHSGLWRIQKCLMSGGGGCLRPTPFLPIEKYFVNSEIY